MRTKVEDVLLLVKRSELEHFVRPCVNSQVGTKCALFFTSVKDFDYKCEVFVPFLFGQWSWIKCEWEANRASLSFIGIHMATGHSHVWMINILYSQVIIFLVNQGNNPPPPPLSHLAGQCTCAFFLLRITTCGLNQETVFLTKTQLSL